MPSLPKDWTVAEVGEFLDQIGLPQLKEAFAANAVSGKDLMESLSDEDMKAYLNCNPLQIRKIRSELGQGSAPAPAAPAPAPAAAAPEPAPVAAPAPAPVPAPAPAAAQAAGPGMPGVTPAQARQYADTYGRAATALRSAQTKLQGALGSLKVTQASGAIDAIRDMRMGRMGRRMGASPGGIRMAQRGGIGGDVLEMVTVQQANKQVQSAAADVEAARALLPSLPYIQPATLGSAKAGVFQNMLFGGTASDVLQMAQVKRSSETITQMEGQVRQALDWACKNQAAFAAQGAQG